MTRESVAICDASFRGFRCTLPPSHSGAHEAWDVSGMVCEAWDNVEALVDAWVEVQSEAVGRAILGRPPAWHSPDRLVVS